MNTTANQILSILEESGEAISGEEISKKTGVTRSAVWKNIKELRERGGMKLMHPGLQGIA